MIAEWIVGGEAPSDLWDVDVRRFGAFIGNRRALAERTGETLGLHYAMRWPRQELETARPLRTSPLYDLLAAKGAEFGSKNGWERANYFQPGRRARARRPTGWARPAGCPGCIDEQRATREAVALYDQTSFGKLLLQGRDALAVLQRLCANEIDVAGRQAWSTPRCSTSAAASRATCTVIRLARRRASSIITGSAQATARRRLDQRATSQPHEHAVLTDVERAVLRCSR